MKKIFKRAAITVAALLFWILIWFFVAEKVSLPLVLPSPRKVFPALLGLMGTGEFYAVLLRSFWHVTLGFLGGMVLGFALGFLTYYLSPVKALVSPLMAIVRATPVASFILVVLFWMEKESVPTFISLLMVLPIVWQNTVLGLEKRDRGLSEMAKVFNLGRIKTFFHMDLPQVMGFVIGAGKAGLGLAWKAGVAAEVLALPKESVGYMIYNAKMYLEMEELYAWTIAIILFSVLFEKLFFFLLKERRSGYAYLR